MKALFTEKLLSDLNPPQKEAVLSVEGPVLVLAGAGSGKTRVLTRRVAYLVGVLGVNPRNVLAVTFTNKAREEMKNRLTDLLGDQVKSLWIGTFHSICVRILRRHAKLIGYTKDFTIYDREDQKRLLKELVKDKKNTRKMIWKISAFKNKRYYPEYEEEIHLFETYKSELEKRNAMDFDDLLLNTLELFKNKEVEEIYAKRFKYIHVDEYQDTNRNQYLILRSLSRAHRNLFVVGDEDQSIYGFRGADIRNILEFEKDFKDAKVIRLEENYRSTGNILKAASDLISVNKMRKGKTLWTRKPPGEKITLYEAQNAKDEARYVTSMILNSSRPYRDFLILYRTNAQSRAFEEALISNGVPYQVIGTVRFYERKEVKDLIAYLKVIVNPEDDISLLRILNIPPRGIGKITVGYLKSIKDSLNISLFESLSYADTMDRIRMKTREKLGEIKGLILKYMSLKGNHSAHTLLLSLIGEIDYFRYIKEKSQDEKEAESREENVKELINMAKSFSVESKENTVSDFLAEISVYTDIDTWKESKNSVTLMTVHNAKGLEFPVVVITGLEEYIFPHRNSHDKPEQLEEERRLFHVALTRAQEKVVLTYSRARYRWLGESKPSRFLSEIPAEVTALDEKSPSEKGETEERPSDREGQPFSPGDRVFHPLFGAGKIIEIYEGKAKIIFRTGTRTFMINMTPLKKI